MQAGPNPESERLVSRWRLQRFRSRQVRRTWQHRWATLKRNYADHRPLLATIALHVVLLLLMAAIAFGPPSTAQAIDTVAAFDQDGEEGVEFETLLMPEVADFLDPEPDTDEAATIELPAVTPGVIDPLAVMATRPVAAVGGGEQRRESRQSESILKRVRREGGRSGEVQFSLAWDDRSDVDLHILTPEGEHISYRQLRSLDGGWLDVDMNVQGESLQPVENVQWADRAPRGRYQVGVHLYRDRANGRRVPFQLRVKIGDDIITAAGTVRRAQPEWRKVYFYKK